MISPLIVLLGLAVLGLAAWRLGRARRTTPRDLAWISGSATLRTDEAAVYSAYLRRHRTYRVVGAIAGVVFAAVIGLRWYLTIWFGLAPLPMANVLVAGIVGCVVGALLAESYVFRRDHRMPRVAASLSARPATAPAGRVLLAARLAVGLAVLGCLVAVLTGTHWLAPLSSALVGVLVLTTAEVTLRAIDHRARPVLSERAAVVDARMRAFGRVRVTWLALSGTVIALGCVGASLGTDVDDLLASADPSTVQADATATSALSWVWTAVLFAGLVVGLWALHRASPYPPAAARTEAEILGADQQPGATAVVSLEARLAAAEGAPSPGAPVAGEPSAP